MSVCGGGFAELELRIAPLRYPRAVYNVIISAKWDLATFGKFEELIEKASQILDLAIAEKQFSAAVAVRSQACA
jgi:hypothetical protein